MTSSIQQKRMQRMGSIDASSTAGTSSGMPLHLTQAIAQVSAPPTEKINWMLWGLAAAVAYLVLRK